MSTSPAGVLHALMLSAQHDPEARNQALTLLRRTALWACTLPDDGALLQTLTTLEGVTTLPLFTDESQLRAAARQHGWFVAPSGRLPWRQVTVTEAVRYARARQIDWIVLDVAAAHVLDLDAGDMELLAVESPAAGPGSSARGLAPVSGASQPSVRPGGGGPGAASSTPAAEGRSKQPSSLTHLRPVSVRPPAADGTVSATFGGSSNAGVAPLTDEVPDELTGALAGALRSYPEVEWACLVMATRGGPGESVPAVGLRVEPSFRVHLGEIIARLREAGMTVGATLDVLVLDDPEQIRQAREVGTPFYPWKKKPGTRP